MVVVEGESTEEVGVVVAIVHVCSRVGALIATRRGHIAMHIDSNSEAFSMSLQSVYPHHGICFCRI